MVAAVARLRLAAIRSRLCRPDMAAVAHQVVLLLPILLVVVAQDWPGRVEMVQQARLVQRGAMVALMAV